MAGDRRSFTGRNVRIFFPPVTKLRLLGDVMLLFGTFLFIKLTEGPVK